jgi:hypothetical protein
MASDEWNRVSQLKPCPICQKPDNCTVSTDGGAVWCGRVAEGATRVNQGGQFLHIQRDGWRGSDWTPAPASKRRTSKSTVRDFGRLALKPVMLETLRFVFWGKLRNPSAFSRV